MPAPQLAVDRLRCEYRVNPPGIDAFRPLLSWIVRSRRRGTLQTACRVIVSASEMALATDQGDLWDSGKIFSDQSIDVRYGGTPLASRQRCCWKVKIWDNHGRESSWSAIAHWSMGLLAARDWQAKWIGLDEEPGAILRASKVYAPCYFRRDFTVVGNPVRAILYASALGWYEFHINGTKVGNDYFTPGWTDPRIRLYYNTYDVTALLRKGANAIGGALSGGWYQWPDGGDKARLLGQLEVFTGDGTRTVIATGKSWRASEGPERYAHILFGEACDARKALTGWARPGFHDAAWERPDMGLRVGKAFDCLYHVPDKPVLEAYPADPVGVCREIRPVALTHPVPREVHIFDMGTNYAGFVRLTIKGAPRGQTLRLRFGEWLNKDGTLYTENLRGARPMMDEYTCAGRSVETWQPRFTFRGHRYVEVIGWPDNSELTLDSITGIELTQRATPTLTFSCGNAMLNKLHEAIAQTRRANTIEAPTDCPQRNERQGWGGDALFFSKTAGTLADLQAFYRKWLTGVLDAQHKDGGFARLAPGNHGYYAGDRDGMPAWADVGVLIPWLLYRTYGDREILERFYDAIGRYLDFRLSTLKRFLRDESQFFYGDWNTIDAFLNSQTSEWGADTSVTYAAYTAETLRTAGRIADTLNHPADAARYRALFGKVKNAFNKAYVNARGMKHPTQGNCALALSFDLVEGPLRKNVARQLVGEFRKHNWNIGAGIASTPEMLFALSDNGHAREAYTVLLTDTFPSWGYMIKCGSPALWEHWGTRRPDLSDDAAQFVPCDARETTGPGFDRHISPAMNSGNHPALGSVGNWLVRSIGGVTPVEPGFKKVLIRPLVDARIGHADIAYDSVYGPIRCAWCLAGRKVTLNVEIPANTTADIWVPATARGLVKQIGSGPGARFLHRKGAFAIFSAGSGRYAFESTPTGLAG